MKRIFFLLAIAMLALFSVACASNTNNANSSTSATTSNAQQAAPSSPLTGKKILVAYFSATNNTKRVAEEIAQATGADIYRIEAAQSYSANPYDDTDRIQKEAYENLRPEVKAPLPASEMAKYDVIFVGSPIWWHQHAMVVCTFLESYDLSGKTVVPFFTYGARSYLNESMQRIYKSTPNSVHVPASLPKDIEPDNIQQPQNDDDGIIMPADVDNIDTWLKALQLK